MELRNSEESECTVRSSRPGGRPGPGETSESSETVKFRSCCHESDSRTRKPGRAFRRRSIMTGDGTPIGSVTACWKFGAGFANPGSKLKLKIKPELEILNRRSLYAQLRRRPAATSEVTSQLRSTSAQPGLGRTSRSPHRAQPFGKTTVTTACRSLSGRVPMGCGAHRK
eukprot:629812-Hanusia_phi.AAC.1